MYAVIFANGLEFDRFMDREDAEIIAASLKAAGRSSARVERVS